MSHRPKEPFFLLEPRRLKVSNRDKYDEDLEINIAGQQFLFGTELLSPTCASLSRQPTSVDPSRMVPLHGTLEIRHQKHCLHERY